jgi:hypothetical protein
MIIQTKLVLYILAIVIDEFHGCARVSRVLIVCNVKGLVLMKRVINLLTKGFFK